MVPPVNHIHTALEAFLDEWHNEAPTVVVHTSGSTGTPKRMEVEKQRMEASARLTCDFLGLNPGDTALLCMPLDYIAGKMVVVRSLVRHLRLIAVQPSGHPLAGLDKSPVFAAMVPMQVYNSLQVPEEHECLRGIQHLLIGGGAIDPALQQALADFPHAVWSTYGMTETLSHIALRRLNGPEASHWYTPFASVSIGLSERGTLTIDAPLVNPQRLTTNDVAEIDDHGRFRILGRTDNTVNSGGIKIQIEQVEALLTPHLPDAFAITSVPDKQLGEALTLLYTGTLPAEQVLSICRQALPPYHCPRHLYAIEALPQTGTGKPARAAIQSLAIDLHKEKLQTAKHFT